MMSEFFTRLTPSEMDCIFHSIQDAIDAASTSPSQKIERTNGRSTVEVVVGDCLNELRKLPSGSAQLVVTSPPYNVGKDYEDRLTIAEWTSNQAEVIAEAARVISNKGSLCWQVGNFVHGGEIIPLDSVIIPLMRDIGLKVRSRIVWTFGHGLHCKHRLSGRTKPSSGRPKAMTTFSTLIRSGCHKSTRRKSITKDRRRVSSAGIRSARIPATSGIS
jgi:hypothetical protein